MGHRKDGSELYAQVKCNTNKSVVFLNELQ